MLLFVLSITGNITLSCADLQDWHKDSLLLGRLRDRITNPTCVHFQPHPENFQGHVQHFDRLLFILKLVIMKFPLEPLFCPSLFFVSLNFIQRITLFQLLTERPWRNGAHLSFNITIDEYRRFMKTCVLKKKKTQFSCCGLKRCALPWGDCMPSECWGSSPACASHVIYG